MDYRAIIDVALTIVIAVFAGLQASPSYSSSSMPPGNAELSPTSAESF
jgi:hypothetical protein